MFSLVKSSRQVEAGNAVAWCGASLEHLSQAQFIQSTMVGPEAKQTAERWAGNRFSQGRDKQAAEDFTICLESPTRVNCCNQAWKKQMHELLYICVTFGQTVPNFSKVDERQPLKFALCGCQQ